MAKQYDIPSQSDLYGRMLYQRDDVSARIDEIAKTIINNYHDKNPLFVCLLRGGAPFSALLMFAITTQDPHFHPEIDYMTVRSYGNKRINHEPGIVMNLSPHTKPEGRPALIIDDVLDTGETAVFTAEQLLLQGASQVDLCVLVKKQKKQPDFKGNILYGFDAPADWLTGMGLDDARIAPEANRWADYIAVAKGSE